MEEISSGVNCLVSPLNSTSMMGLVALSMILKGQSARDGKCQLIIQGLLLDFLPHLWSTTSTEKHSRFMSAWTSASANLRPMRRLASKTVLK
jgi:hypothetical protein